MEDIFVEAQEIAIDAPVQEVAVGIDKVGGQKVLVAELVENAIGKG